MWRGVRINTARGLAVRAEGIHWWAGWGVEFAMDREPSQSHLCFKKPSDFGNGAWLVTGHI